MASLKSQYHFVRQLCCCAIFLSSDCVTNSLYSNFFAFATFRSIFSLMKCLRNSRTSLSKVYYFTVALEATLVGKLLSCWRIYVLIVYLLGHVFLVVLVDLEVPYLFFHCAGISALCDWTKSTQRSSCFNSQWNNHFFQFVLSETLLKLPLSLPHYKTFGPPCNLFVWTVQCILGELDNNRIKMNWY